MFVKRILLCIVASGLLVSGCSRIPPADDGLVSCLVSNRIDSQAEWHPDCIDDHQIQDFISSAVSSELSPDIAIQIALLNNPKVQASFEEVGISRANLVEAGLLTNPSFALELRFPCGGMKTNIEYLLTSSLLDLFLIPLRTKLAQAEYEQTKLRVSNDILDLAFDVREIYYALMMEQKKLQYVQSKVGLTSILRDISSKQIAVNNINTLEFQFAQAHFLEAELELMRSKAEVISLKEKFNRLLGFCTDACLIFPEIIDIDEGNFDLCALEKIALENRLDIQIARLEIVRLSRMLGLKEWWTYSHLQGGLAGEREPEGTHFIGPGFAGDIPIFNYGQAARMRLFAQLRQAQDRLAELEIKVLSDVRRALKSLTSYAEIIQDYKTRLIPLQGQILTSSEELYNVMGLGVNKLLESKRQELIAIHDYAESLKRYLIARVELDRALGGYLYKFLSQMNCEGCYP